MAMPTPPAEQSITDLADRHVVGLRNLAQRLDAVLSDIRGARPQQTDNPEPGRPTLIDHIHNAGRLEREIGEMVSELEQRFSSAKAQNATLGRQSRAGVGDYYGGQLGGIAGQLA